MSCFCARSAICWNEAEVQIDATLTPCAHFHLSCLLHCTTSVHRGTLMCMCLSELVGKFVASLITFGVWCGGGPHHSQCSLAPLRRSEMKLLQDRCSLAGEMAACCQNVDGDRERLVATVENKRGEKTHCVLGRQRKTIFDTSFIDCKSFEPTKDEGRLPDETNKQTNATYLRQVLD